LGDVGNQTGAVLKTNPYGMEPFFALTEIASL
jgi:hypothetical protein